ncbi:MAG: hypothetical protein NVS4B2_15970 [Chloroflexota bacterium]
MTGPAILIALLVLLAIGGVAFAIQLHRNSDLSVALPPKPAAYAFVFVLNGVGASDLHQSSLPSISSLSAHGTSYGNAWVGQLEPTAITANATIGTGLYPRHHGVLGREWGSPLNGRLESPTGNTQVQLGKLDQLMQSRAGDSLAARIKARYPNDHIASAAGNECGLADAGGTWAADYVLCARRQDRQWLPGSVTGHAPSVAFDGAGASSPVSVGRSLAAKTEGWGLGRQDDWISRYTERVMNSGRLRLTIVTFPEIELVRRFAPAGQQRGLVQRLLQGIDGDIGRIVARSRRLRQFDRSVFVVTSDQALAPIAQRVRRTRLDTIVAASGGETVYSNADMAAMIGLRDRLQIPLVAGALKTLAPGRVDAIYAKTTNRTSQSYRMRFARAAMTPAFRSATAHLVQTMEAPGSPDIVVLYAPFVGTGHLHAGPFLQTFGGLGMQWPNQNIPMIIAGHGVVEGRASGYPAQLVDVAPTIEALMGLRAAGDGVVLADAMYAAPRGALQAQQQRDRQLAPLVQALQRRARRSTF